MNKLIIFATWKQVTSDVLSRMADKVFSELTFRLHVENSHDRLIVDRMFRSNAKGRCEEQRYIAIYSVEIMRHHHQLREMA